LAAELKRLHSSLKKALAETAALWPELEVSYLWVHQAARILDNSQNLDHQEVKQRFAGLLGAMSHHRQKAGTLEPAVDHFLKVTRSYWPGLFHCYKVPDLPRTNNDLEQFFGSHRYHECRTNGRKTASPSLVLRGSVQLIAATASRLQTFSATDLAPSNLQAWTELRRELEQRRHTRTLQRRFRRDPAGYLAQLEQDFLQLSLPA
jgi:hypothetical protein